ncbi:Hypothetical predicted protein [Mytilus galloprovincialis]|uniref:Ig-like domain-containing protein n=1 Tax=Mytilus galloprovincialis TaxID=29158 RepID=A0A8B6CBG1_MYTGA|nr:Hypothetical predicted protein [Mytilus galloprovincialis]
MNSSPSNTVPLNFKSLFILGLPIVTEKRVYNLPSLTFSASIYAVPPPIEICWFIGNEQIQNSTGYVQTFTKTLIERNLHGQAIKQIGFSVNLTVRNNAKTKKKITLLVQNDIGNITDMFFVDDKVSFSAANLDQKDIIWFLSGTVILILIVTLSACVFKYHSRRGDRDIINMRTMYNVAETGHSNVNQYDMVEPIPNYVEINSIPSNQSTTLQHEYEEIDKEEEYAHENEYEEAHEYTEVF